MSIVPNLRFPNHDVWATVVLLFCLLLFVWVRIINPKKIPSLVSSFFGGGTTEEKTITPDSIALFFIFICSAVLLAMQAFRFFQRNPFGNGIQTRVSPFEEFLLLGLVLLAYYLVKTIVLLFCGIIFRVQMNARDYVNEIFASAHLAALGLLPAAIILTFMNNINVGLFEKCILALIVLFFVYRTIKMFIVMINRGLRIMYLFLYLCTLEIIPLVLIYEMQKGY